MQIDRDQLKRLLLQNDCSLTKTAQQMGISPQRVEQLMKGVGLRIEKGIVEVDPEAKSEIYKKGGKR